MSHLVLIPLKSDDGARSAAFLSGFFAVSINLYIYIYILFFSQGGEMDGWMSSSLAAFLDNFAPV